MMPYFAIHTLLANSLEISVGPIKAYLYEEKNFHFDLTYSDCNL